MQLFSNLLLLKPPQFLLEAKRFASIGFSALCDLPETLIKNFSRKYQIFFRNFRPLRGFLWSNLFSNHVSQLSEIGYNVLNADVLVNNKKRNQCFVHSFIDC